MKKLLVLIILFVAVFVVSAQSQTNTSSMPADVSQVLKEAVMIEQADPPIDLAFLWGVNFDESVVKYLDTFHTSIIVNLEDVYLHYVYERKYIFVSLPDDSCPDMIECNNDGPYLVGSNSSNQDYCTAMLLSRLRVHRQSEFWVALKEAVQKYLPPDHNK